MNSTLEVDRLIGDCFEINGDIIYQELNGKGPLFFRKARSKYYRNRLIKSVKRLKDSKAPLLKSQLSEFFTYIFNNYPLDGKYRSVRLAKVNEGFGIEAIVSFEENNISYLCIFSIPSDEKYFNLNLKVKKRLGVEQITESFNIPLLELKDNDNTNSYISTINDVLLEDLSIYIIDNLSMYGKKK